MGVRFIFISLAFYTWCCCGPWNLQMSLLLVQGYESPEEEVHKFFSDSDVEDVGHSELQDKAPTIAKPTISHQTGPPARTSILPTAYEMFTEVRLISMWLAIQVNPMHLLFMY